MTRFARAAVAAGSIAVCVAVINAAAPATARVHHRIARVQRGGRRRGGQGLSAEPRTAVPAETSSSLPSGARLLGHLAARTPMTVTVAFKPRNRRLLDQLAAHSAGHPGLPISEIRRILAPPRPLIAETTGYLSRYGLRHVSTGLLTATYRGQARSVQRAFRTTLSTYRRGALAFHAPTVAPSLPSSLARHVQLVDGLNSFPRYRPMTSLTACSSATDAQTAYGGGLTPQQLASSSGYDAQGLITAGDDGNGGVIDFVEYATYNTSDISDYESCYGAGMSGPVDQIDVAGGTSSVNGLNEVELDDEAALALAPGIDHIYNYDAPAGVTQGEIIDQMLSDAAFTHVTEISTSWGVCEPLAYNGELADTDVELELAAVAGIPVFAATGDDGPQGCLQDGLQGQYANYPASDPYATAVGGTTLNLSTVGADHETAWGTPATASGGAGGGGVSMYYPMPTWQTGTGVIEGGYSSFSKCGQTFRYCRELPDVSVDANSDTGPIIDCTTHCGTGTSGWQLLGGTSDAAPMLAALVADADTYSLANGGTRLGFANPFFYGNSGTGVLNDITVGSNGTASYTGYPAGTGYDMATGLGSIDANVLAQQVAGYTNPSNSISTTSLTATESHTALPAGGIITLSGTLTNTATSTVMAGRTVYVEGFFSYHGHLYAYQKLAVTDSFGKWSTSASFANVGSRMVWQAVYPGEQNFTSAASPSKTLRVIPQLGFGANTTYSPRQHVFIIYRTRKFTVLGASNPNMRGFRFTLQYRKTSSGRWHMTTIRETAGRKGRWSARIHVDSGTKIQMRWHYKGSKSGEYLSANSPTAKFIIKTPG